MLSQISVRQFEEWRAYADLEPWDEGRADLRAASIVRELRQLFASDGGRRVWKLDDCLLVFGGDTAAVPGAPPRSDADIARGEILNSLNMLAAVYGAKRRKVEKKPRKGR